MAVVTVGVLDALGRGGKPSYLLYLYLHIQAYCSVFFTFQEDQGILRPYYGHTCEAHTDRLLGELTVYWVH